jgi:hypothetical protein
MSEFVAEAWTNDLGQTLQLGDDVVAVGTSCKTTSISVGKFAGVRRALVYRTNYTKDENGNQLYVEAFGRRQAVTTSTTTNEVVAVVVHDVPVKRFKYDYATNKGEYVQGFKKMTLPLMRVFAITTTAADLSKVYL